MKNNAALAAFFVCLFMAVEAGAVEYAVDAKGQPFRVDFPLHDRVWFSAGVDVFEPVPHFGLEYAVQFDLDFPDEEIWWQLRSGFLGSHLTATGDGTLGLARGEYLRHDVSSFIVVPADVDWRVPAPFDLAVDWRLLRVGMVEFKPTSIEAIAMSLSVDFCRDETFRSRCAVGVNTDYAYDFEAKHHVITSFSTGSVRLQHQTDDGRFGVSLRGDAGWKLFTSSEARQWKAGWVLSGSLEWTLLAINDQPVSLVVQAEHDQWDNAYKVGSALRLSFPTR